MTKTLTEQWREGTLRGCFYWKLPNGNICTAYTDTMRDIKNVRDSDEVEVLAPVPSYTELTLMAGNYRLAKKALRDCYNEMKYWAKMNHRCSKIFNQIKATLVEIEEVK